MREKKYLPTSTVVMHVATSFHKPSGSFHMRLIVCLASLVLVATRTLAAAAETKKTWQNQMLL